jgi:hypothetical protein
MARAEGNNDEVLYPWHRTVLGCLPSLSGMDVLEVGRGPGDYFDLSVVTTLFKE